MKCTNLLWQQWVGYVDSTFLDCQQCPGETIHTTSFSLYPAPLEFRMIGYNAVGRVGGEGKPLAQSAVDTRNTSGCLLTSVPEITRFLAG